VCLGKINLGRLRKIPKGSRVASISLEISSNDKKLERVPQSIFLSLWGMSHLCIS
jgi:hypothetical protein